MRAILISVNYADLLSITLPYNRHHFSEVWVVTTLSDHQTMKVANDNGAHIVTTDLFTANGALFNKFAALEHGLDVMGRHGWLCIMDADILWPRSVTEGGLLGVVRDTMFREGNLYTPRRRMLEDFNNLTLTLGGGIPWESTWKQFPLHPQQQEFAGYTQIFHATDRHLGKPPWHETDWTTAGGPDSFFQAKWPDSCKIRPPWECLHLGPAGANWAGRVTPLLDGTVPVEARERSDRLRQILSSRRGKSGNARFNSEKIVRE